MLQTIFNPLSSCVSSPVPRRPFADARGSNEPLVTSFVASAAAAAAAGFEAGFDAPAALLDAAGFAPALVVDAGFAAVAPAAGLAPAAAPAPPLARFGLSGVSPLARFGLAAAAVGFAEDIAGSGGWSVFCCEMRWREGRRCCCAAVRWRSIRICLCEAGEQQAEAAAA